MKVKVNVTPDVLERSKMCGVYKRYKGDSCGVAIAIIDLFPSAQTGKNCIFLLSDGPYTEDDLSKTSLPWEAQQFITKFDSLQPEERVLMSPFSFEIEVPEYVIDKIGISNIYKVLSESRTLEMVM